MKVAIAILTCVVAALAFVGCGRKDVPSGEVKPMAQQLMPRSGSDIEGQEHTLFDTTNRGVLFVFTLQDCPIANAYAPKIQRIQSRYESQGIRFFLVHVDPAASLAQLRQHQEDYGYRCTILHDKEHQLVRFAQATVTPQAVLFDAEGTKVYSGRIDDQYVDFGSKRPRPTSEDLIDAVDALVSGRPLVSQQTDAVGCYIADLLPVEHAIAP